MSYAYHKMNEDCQKIKLSSQHDIRIYLDITYRNRLYYSDEAKKYLEFAEKTDPAIMKIPNWEKLNTTQKKEYIHRLKNNFIHKADSINDISNVFHFALENHTTDSIEIILSDFSVLSFTEAKNRSGEWHPIEYWGYSDCGLSIKKIRQPPSTKRFIAIHYPNEGDFKTKGRLKVYINNQTIYSEEFDITIDECRFKPHAGNTLTGINWFTEDQIPILNKNYKMYRLRTYGSCP